MVGFKMPPLTGFLPSTVSQQYKQTLANKKTRLRPTSETRNNNNDDTNDDNRFNDDREY